MTGPSAGQKRKQASEYLEEYNKRPERVCGE